MMHCPYGWSSRFRFSVIFGKNDARLKVLKFFVKCLTGGIEVETEGLKGLEDHNCRCRVALLSMAGDGFSERLDYVGRDPSGIEFNSEAQLAP